MSTSSLVLWRDRRDRLSYPRIATLLVLVWPVALAAYDGALGRLTGRPLNEIIHRSGWWALVFLLVSLAVTPLRRAGRYGPLVDLRRMIGVAAFCYGALHISLYVVDQHFDLLHVASEIALRLYLTIGFVALLGLAVLAITSNDAMVKRIGGLRWRRLHQVAYAIGVLALVHYFQQTKADVSVPTAYAGVFAWLMGYRLLAAWRGEGALTALWLVILSVVAAALTFIGEAMFIAYSFGQPLTSFAPQYVATLLDTDLGIRPGWYVLGIGLLVAGLDLLRGATARSGSSRVRPATARSG